MAGELLFYSGDLRGTLENIRGRLVEEVEQAPEEHVLQADEGQWAAALAERYSVEAPTLHPERMWQDPPTEVKVDVSHERFTRALPEGGGPFYVPGYRVVVHIPFSGDGGVFKLQATLSMNPPRAIIRPGELQDVIDYPHDSPVDIKARAQALANKVEQHLTRSRADIDQHNRELEQTALNAIRTRRERIERHREHIEETGLPIGPPDEQAKTYIAEAVVRKPAPELPPSSSEEPIMLEPVLADEVFEHILTVIRSVAEQMERSPKTYEAMGEEDRRQVMLTALNSHYRGKATAEAFNVRGKTDILVRHEGDNLFIAECKFWSGAKAFAEAVDQLLGYTAWRDTKLALVMFVKERQLTDIIERARASLQEHAQFVAWRDAVAENELRAEVAWPGDERRHADLNVFFVHTLTSD